MKTSLVVKIVPRCGFVDEGCESVTVTRPVSRSPGRTGAVQRRLSMPGEPIDAESSRMPRTNSPMKSAAVCQPLAINPPNGPVLRRDRVDVERLRVVALRELDDLALCHVDRAELRHVADREVFPVAHST